MSPSKYYYVIEFLTLPRPDVDKYVCVPETWIKWINKSSSTVRVAYPEGNSAEIDQLAKDNQSNTDYWYTYYASVKYSTTSYEIAKNYLRIQRVIAYSKIMTSENSIQDSSNVLTNQRRSSAGPSRQTLKRPRSATTSNSGGDDVNNKAYKRPFLVNFSTKAPMKQIRPHTGLQRSLGSHSMNFFQHTNSSTSMHDVNAARNVLHSSQRGSNSTNHGFCAKQFDSIIGIVHELASNFNHWAAISAKNNEKIIEVNSWMKEHQIRKRTISSQLSERSSISKVPQKIKAEIIYVEDDDDINNGTTTTTMTAPREVLRNKIAGFSLPPEYNPRDSRWTLRYRCPGPKLKELIPNSRIYVDPIKVACVLLLASDCKSFTRMLMIEVFSDNALVVCSFTGARSPFYSPGSPVRPGLDENVRNILVKFTEEHGRQKGWHIPDVQTINKSMRAKLEECRRKVMGRK